VAQLQGKDVIPMVQCNSKGSLIGGGKVAWLTALQGYVLKLNLTIDNI
jgi:hypothetical protein